MIPESSAAHSLDLYRFASFPNRPELATRLIEGLELVDSTPLLLNGVWYLFTSTIEPFVESWLLTAPDLEGPWSVHPASPISSSIRNSRSAGNLVWDGDRLFRFTQDSAAGYGYGIQVNEVTRLTPTEFEEHSVNYLGPDWADNILGTHTWNATMEVEVIDAKY
ncbi:MAG: hypothetical protein NTW74_17150 [Acidobacteria bacterium]|nr:hypothetical protein [Acidobacteriota bacterium]